MPYALIHDGLLMPLFGCIVLGLAGNNPLAYALGWRPLVFVGEASYCLYLLHFNFWNLIHDSHVLDRLGLSRFDPWISYVLLIGMALAALHFVEKPAQRVLRGLDARLAVVAGVWLAGRSNAGCQVATLPFSCGICDLVLQGSDSYLG